MKIFAKKKTEVYRNGKLVNTMERKMTESQYHKDVAQKLIDSATLGGRKAKVTRSSPWSGSKVDKIEERAVDSSSGNRYRYVTNYTFPEPKARKSYQDRISRKKKKAASE